MDDFLSALHTRLASKRLKDDIEAAADLIGPDPDRFRIAFDALQTWQPPIRERLAWTLQVATERHPAHASSATSDRALAFLPQAGSDAEKRAMQNILRATLPSPAHIAPLFDLSLEWFVSPAQAIAVRVYALDILTQIARIEPGLAPEVDTVIDMVMQEPGLTPAMMANRFMKAHKRRNQAKSKRKS